MPGRRQQGQALEYADTASGLPHRRQLPAVLSPPLGNLGSPEIFNDNRQVPDNIPPRVEHAFAHRYLYPVPGSGCLSK